MVKKQIREIKKTDERKNPFSDFMDHITEVVEITGSDTTSKNIANNNNKEQKSASLMHKIDDLKLNEGLKKNLDFLNDD